MGDNMLVKDVIRNWCKFQENCCDGCNSCEKTFGALKVPCTYEAKTGCYTNIESIIRAQGILSADNY